MLIFISHGAPSIAIETDGFTRAVEQFGMNLSPAVARLHRHREL